MKFWKSFFACFLAVVASGLLAIIVFVSFVVALVSSSNQMVSIDNHSVLTLDLSETIVEVISDDMSEYLDLMSFELNVPITQSAVVSAIQRAAVDARIDGVYIKVPMVVAASQSTLYEIRCALQYFKAAAPEKFIVAYGDYYSQGALYVASVADSIFVNPSGAVSWLGMSVSPTFYKGTLDKLGISAEVIRHGKFKGAVEPYILSKLSAENRVQYQSLIDSNWGYLVDEIASARGLSNSMLDSAATNITVRNSSDAKLVGLVDELYYRDQLEEWLKRMSDEDYELLSVVDYSRTEGSLYSKNKIKVIYADGEIVDEGSSSAIVGNRLASKLAEARKDDDVKAIVLRVNSPGGSALASEVIAREVRLAHEAKPLVISMGDCAASGGYWISAQSSKIVASPSTITGSIGVFGLHFNVQKGASDLLGITVDPVTTNPSADMGSLMRSYTPLERQAMQNNVEEIYNSFLKNVAKGRDMTVEKVDEIGQGRVWTGLQAQQLGLVDEIGTLDYAILLAAIEAGVEDDYMVKMDRGGSDSFWGAVFDVSSAIVAKVLPSFTSTKLDEMIVQKLIKEQCTVQARLPFNLNVVN